MWMIDFEYTSNEVIHVFDFENFSQQKLLDEAYSRQYEPFEVPMDDINSDPNWFNNGVDVHMDQWTQARFFGHEEDGSDNVNNYPETNRVTKYFANIIGTKDIRPRFYKLEAGGEVPEHVDHNTKCGVNIILNDTDISTFCTTNYGDDIYIYNLCFVTNKLNTYKFFSFRTSMCNGFYRAINAYF